jgi:hypothetical protein
MNNENKIIVCANGKMFGSMRSLTTNTWNFIYTNKTITTGENITAFNHHQRKASLLKQIPSVNSLTLFTPMNIYTFGH